MRRPVVRTEIVYRCLWCDKETTWPDFCCGLCFEEYRNNVGKGIMFFYDGYSLAGMELRVIMRALERCDYVQKEAALLLGISPRILNYRIKKYGIRHPSWRVNI